MNTAKLPPLFPGDYALRVRLTWRDCCGEAKAFVCGLEVVQVLEVDGDLVVWTNYKASKHTGGKFVSKCHRAALLRLGALEELSAAPDEISAALQPVAGAGAAESIGGKN